ncbi:MAG: YcxB family protein [Treponemataceae bacterium]|nr:YcxB family protein [Treponemataceae bacterium]
MFEFDYIFDEKTIIAGRDFLLAKYMLALKIFLPLFISFIFLKEYLATKDTANIIALVAALAVLAVFSFAAQKWSKKKYIKNSSNFIGMKVNIVFTDEKVVIKTQKQNQFEQIQEYEWSQIYKIVQNDSYYFVYLSKLSSHIIPKGSCISGNEADFAAFAETRINNLAASSEVC